MSDIKDTVNETTPVEEMPEKKEQVAAAEAPKEAPKKKKEVLPGVKMLQDIVTGVYQAAWDAKAAGKPVGWS